MAYCILQKYHSQYHSNRGCRVTSSLAASSHGNRQLLDGHRL